MDTDRAEEIARLIEEGAAVLTVNKRLSRAVHNGFDSLMMGRGLAFWKTPVIMPLTAWAGSLKQEAFAGRPVISRVRSRALWERIIRHDNGFSDGLLIDGAAESAMKAYSILKDYNLRLPDDELYLTQESKAFKRWAYLYEEELKKAGFADGADTISEAAGLIGSGIVELPRKIVLAGFDELTPAVRVLISRMEARGVGITYWPRYPAADPVLKDRITVRPYADEAEEVCQAARWIRSVIRPGVRIGVIVPELERYRELMKREFSSELAPASVLPWEASRNVFNISLGNPLYDEPLVRSAIDILMAGEGVKDLDGLFGALKSPFFAGAGEEMTRLCGVDAGFRADNTAGARLEDVKKRLGSGSGGLEKRLGVWINELGKMRKKELPGAWAKGFSELLEKIGWLSPVRLTSEEYQALMAWNRLLEDFAGLDDILGRMTGPEAASRLARLARQTVHQPETADAQVEVMGLLESAGQFFDFIRIIGCHEYALPAQPAPNPFIPLYLQKKHNIARSSHEAEAAFADAVMQRLSVSAPVVEASYPRQSEQRALRASPLVAGCREDTALLGASTRLKDAVHAAFEAEPVEDDEKIPVGDEERKALRGGTGIIKDQSICPFKAFARYRLNARPLSEPEPGLDAAQRGSILHNALKALWDDIKDSERLKALIGSGGLEAFVRDKVEKVFEKVHIPAPLSRRFREMEKARLHALLADWLKIEAKRAAFRVKRLEAERIVDIGGLKITERPDRVDELSGGGEAIIDYKTSDADRDDWLTDRPKDPQLIIYSLLNRYSAITFARLKPGDCRFIGISLDDGVLPGVKPFDDDGWRRKAAKEGAGDIGWDGLMEFWKSSIEGLAAGFLGGTTAVDPNGDLEGENSPCRHCGLTVLCRVVEAGGVIMGEDS